MEKIYRQWVSDYQHMVWSLAVHLLRDRAGAEDISQEAFVRLWQHAETMNPERVKPWLLRVTRNLCLDQLRRDGRDESLSGEEVSGEAGPALALQSLSERDRLRALVAQMAEPQRSLVVLRDIEQHSYQDVAEITGLSQPQVKTYLHRARRSLRQLWSETDND